MQGKNSKQPSQAQSPARPFFQKWLCFSNSSTVISPNESCRRDKSKIYDLQTRENPEDTPLRQQRQTTRRHSSNGRASELEEYLGAAASKRWLLRINQSPPTSLQVLDGSNFIESTNPSLSTELTTATTTTPATTPTTSASTLLNLSSYYNHQSPSPPLQHETMAECGSFTLKDKQSTILSSSSSYTSADPATTTPTTPPSGDTKTNNNGTTKSSSSPTTLMMATYTPHLSERPPAAGNNVTTTTTTNSGSGNDDEGATLLHLSSSTANISLQTTNSDCSNASSPTIPTDSKGTNTNNTTTTSTTTNKHNGKHSSNGSNIIRKHSAVMIIPAEAEPTLPTTVQRKISDVCDGHHVRLAKIKAQMGNMEAPPPDLLSLFARKVFSQQGQPGGLGGRVKSDGTLSDLIVDSKSSMSTATATPPVEEEEEEEGDEMPVVMDLPPIKTKVVS